MYTKQKIEDSVKPYRTAVLFEILDKIEEKPRAERTHQDRLVAAVVSDVIEIRHGLTGAMDAIYNDLEYTGTYTEALKTAYASSTD